ncbi:MAG: transposase [Bosea sp.]|nr:transposase [Bosea sp. (in: a-proteobacteria)]
MGERIGLSDEEWELIGPLLPSERGRGCRPAGDNRPFFEGMMWMARTGSQWRHLPDEYGKWNSVFRRYRRWVETGVFDAMLETLAEMAGRERSADMIDSQAASLLLVVRRLLVSRQPRDVRSGGSRAEPSENRSLPTMPAVKRTCLRVPAYVASSPPADSELGRLHGAGALRSNLDEDDVRASRPSPEADHLGDAPDRILAHTCDDHGRCGAGAGNDFLSVFARDAERRELAGDGPLDRIEDQERDQRGDECLHDD